MRLKKPIAKQETKTLTKSKFIVDKKRKKVKKTPKKMNVKAHTATGKGKIAAKK